MINILSYIGMNIQSEVCLWTLFGLIRTIFDATLFRVNANLKQVWQMSMPTELSMPLQRGLRTMISGVMLVQCFTVYIYLASYIVLLYPVFLEERPTLVLPWLLLAAIRKLLCELTSLALGLGTCVLLGPARPPCIKFVVIKLISIMPSVYMWMLVFTYYHALKMAGAFKTFPAVLPPSDHDYGLELAIRRRRTKSLLGEEQLRTKLVASLYGDRSTSAVADTRSKSGMPSRMMHSTDTSLENLKANMEVFIPTSVISHKVSESGSYEDWSGSEVVIPRDTDRILEQFVLMMLRIGAYLNKEGANNFFSTINCDTPTSTKRVENLKCTAIPSDDTDTPPLVGSIRENTASYLREYPQIFMKKSIDNRSESKPGTSVAQAWLEAEENANMRSRKSAITSSSVDKITPETEKNTARKKIIPSDKSNQITITSTTTSYKSKQSLNFKDIDSFSKITKDPKPTDPEQNQENIIEKAANTYESLKITEEPKLGDLDTKNNHNESMINTEELKSEIKQPLENKNEFEGNTNSTNKANSSDLKNNENDKDLEQPISIEQNNDEYKLKTLLSESSTSLSHSGDAVNKESGKRNEKQK